MRASGWWRRGRERLLSIVTSDTAPERVRASAFAALIAVDSAGDVSAALAQGEALLPRVAGSAFAHQVLAEAYRGAFSISRRQQLLASAKALGGWGVGLAKAEMQQAWLSHGLELSEPVGTDPGQRHGEPRRILYVAASARPHHTAGYAARTHALVSALGRRGWDMHVVTRSGYPNDRADVRTLRLAEEHQTVDGIPYTFAPHRRTLLYARDPQRYHALAVATLERQCRALRPSLLHAASNYNVGLAALEVGRRIGIPVIYEVRGLWHVSKAASSPRYLGSDHYRMVERFEVQAASLADHVFVITSGVANALVAAGAPREHMSLLPNAADVRRFAPQDADSDEAMRLGLGGAVVFGYVGTLNDYEGVDDLLAAVARLRASGVAAAALVVGDGPAGANLRQLAERHGLGAAAVFTGRVPPDAVQKLYTLMDVFVLPRKPTLVCELVSPLKPFEAMAMNRCVVASNVVALMDIVADGETGRLFGKGDVDSLVAVLTELAGDKEQRNRLGAAGGHWVRTQRTWDVLSLDVDAVYRRLLQRA